MRHVAPPEQSIAVSGEKKLKKNKGKKKELRHPPPKIDTPGGAKKACIVQPILNIFE